MSVIQKNIDQIIRTKTTIDGSERLPARDNSGDFKITVTNLLKEFQQSGLRPLAITAASYTITDSDLESYDIFIADTTSSSVAITIPDLATNYGALFKILYGVQVGTNTVTVNRAGSDTITADDLTSIELPVVGNFIELFASSVTGKYEILSESITCKLRLYDYAGYGSTDTKIMRFTNKTEYVGNMFAQNHDSGYDSNAEGLELTVARSGYYSGSYGFQHPAAITTYGFSLDSSQLTTAIGSITDADILAISGQGTSGIAGNGFVGFSPTWLAGGSIVRIHTNGVTTISGSYPYLNFNYNGQG